MKSSKKRETEIRALQGLLERFRPEDVPLCFQYVLSGKVSKSTIHSPLSYLAHAIDDVLKTVRPVRLSESEQQKPEAARVAREAMSSDKARESDSNEAGEWEQRKRLFAQYFRSVEAQDQYVAQVTSNLAWKPHRDTAFSIAVGTWISQQGRIAAYSQLN